MFKPGTKVSFLNENLEGTIVSKGPGRQWYVDIGGGFEIPVAENDIVSADQPSEGEKPSEQQTIEEEHVLSQGEPSEEGLFLAFEKGINETELVLFFVNNGQHALQFSLHTFTSGVYHAVSAMEVQVGTKTRAGKFRLDRLEEWNRLYVQLIFNPFSAAKMPAPVVHELHITGQRLRKSFKHSSFFNKEVFIFKLQEEKVNVQAEKEEEEPLKPSISIEAPPEVLDLHLEKLFPGQTIKLEQAKELQLEVFRSALEKAIALDYPKMVIIHGMGSGRLKQEVVNLLKKEPRVHIIRDADSREYGYGATEVIFKG